MAQPEAMSTRRSTARPWRGLLMTGTGLLTAVVATTIVVRSGDPAFTTDGPPTRTVVATPEPRPPSAPPTAVTVTVADLPPETPVRVAPSSAPAAPEAFSVVDPRKVTYTIAGNQRPDDPVTITYADDTGTLRTVGNITLPWTMTVVPQVPVNYVTASSFGSQLNCWITDATGATVASAVDNSTTTTCNR